MDWPNEKYRIAICSEHFKQLRLSLLNDIGKCEVCGLKYVFRKVGLTLHHKHYRTLGHETRDDVVLICRRCHAAIHAKKDRESRRKPRKLKATTTKNIEWLEQNRHLFNWKK